jgi:hypothetical protein
MVQKFSNDQEENKFFEVWEGLLAGTFADLEDFFENVYKSPELANALYDSQAVEVWGILEKKFFLKIFATLIESGYTAGVVDTYCNVIYLLFGNTTNIEILATNPLEINIDIVAEYQNFSNFFTKTGYRMFTKSGFAIVFKTLLTDIPRSQLTSLLKAMTNAGTKVNFNLN